MRIAVAAGALLLLASPPAFSQGDWVDIKDPAELRALYSNKTLKGKDQVCVQTQFDRRCFLFQRHSSKAATFRSINVANDLAVAFVAEEGVPKF
jgi:hypothetical protein